jgi:hypothetical protein
MRTRHWIVLAILVLPAAGCGKSQALEGTTNDPREFRGFADQSLPPADAARQQALGDILEDVRAGCKLEDIKKRVSSIDFQETSARFLEGGAKLVRWSFDGRPKGNDVPVILYVSSGSGQESPKEIRRTYRVTQQRGRFTIVRA